MLTVLVVVLLALLILGAAPLWPYNRGQGYAPAGALTVILLVIVLLWALGRI